jgi:hypothetical protein
MYDANAATTGTLTLVAMLWIQPTFGRCRFSGFQIALKNTLFCTDII